MNKHEEYREQVALVLRILPHIYELEQLAVHGGTAINLFHKNMPRYSVDIDLTYLPIEDRETSLCEINRLLGELRLRLLERVKGIRVIHKPDVWKLLCTLEKGEPDWSVCSAGDLSRFPSVQWKQRNIEKLRDLNPEKYVQGVEKLERYLDGRR